MGITGFQRRRREHGTNRKWHEDEQPQDMPQENEQKPASEPVHIGGGWYEVNGERYQGREAAERAIAEQE